MRGYKKEKKEGLLYCGKGIGLCVLVGALFYQSIIGILCLLPMALVVVKLEKQEGRRRQKVAFKQGFADGLASLLAALEAGYAVENALTESIRDLSLLYPESSPILREFRQMQYQLQNNFSMEEAIAAFAKRSKDEDIETFSEVFSTAKRTGGDLLQIIRATERTISEKVEVSREIQTAISAKRLEAGIMNCMPLGILVYFRAADPTFLEPLYQGIFGRLVMTVLLLAYGGCVLISRHITQIEV